MYITNITDDYNDNNCTNKENIIDMIIPTLLFKIPCGLSFLCLLSFMVYTLIKQFFNNKSNEYSYKYLDKKISILI